MALKMIVLVLSLGIDTLVVSIALGIKQQTGRVKIAIAFVCAEAIMPLLGLLVGRAVGHVIHHWTSYIGGAALMGVAVWMIVFDDDDDDVNVKVLGWSLVITALSISLDELAVGLSMGLLGVPIGWTIVLIALQALVFTMIGLTFGASLKPHFGEWAEKAPGIVLGLLGCWIIVQALI